jgi:ABC-type ATPase involved in cell division
MTSALELRRVSNSDRAKMRRRSIGYVFQEFKLLRGLSAVGILTLPLELDGVPSKAGPGVSLAATPAGLLLAGREPPESPAPHSNDRASAPEAFGGSS